MVNPYLLMALLFSVMAAVQAVDAALINAEVLPASAGLRWLRVHLITLGMMTEVLFGVLPLVVAWRNGVRPPAVRWSVWLLLNGGIVALLVGIPSVSMVATYTGGGMVFAATVLLLDQLRGMRVADAGGRDRAPSGRWFYLTGLAYFLVGITVGTGLFFNWAGVLRIKTPIEVHIHANNWGLMSFAFAGLLIDLYPQWSGRTLAWPRSVTPIFWLMTLGALGLVLGPWLGALPILVPGLLMHLVATIWLMANVVRPLRGHVLLGQPGIWHLITGYAWLVAPLLVAPFILLQVPGFPGAGIEANAPQALVYGWVLQVGYALLPYLFARVLRPGAPALLGGSWLSLGAVHLGSVLLWAGIFVGPLRAELHGAAYGLWALSLVPVVAQLWRIVQAASAAIEDREVPAAGG